MDTFNRHSEIALPADLRNRFCGIAFDGCFFYLTAPQECGISVFKRDFTLARSVVTGKPFSGICYDSTEKCFWATSGRHIDEVFKLDRSLNEIGRLQIKDCQKGCSGAVGISLNCENDTLLIAYKEQIVEVSKESGLCKVVQRTCDGCFTAVLSIAPYFAAILQSGQSQVFQIYGGDGCPVKSFCIPDSYCIRDLLFFPCNDRCRDELEFMLLATKHCHSTVILVCSISACGMDLSCCNYKVCCAHCGDDPCKGDDCERQICDVIESVALIETSLSHILNAEGEKLQKAIELASCVEELLAVNRSVTKTIIAITQLEHQLFLKLDALSDLRKEPID